MSASLYRQGLTHSIQDKRRQADKTFASPDRRRVKINHENEYSYHPAQFLVDNIGLLPVGKVLDIAMGAGRNSLYLARMGFEVEGVDISSEAVEIARQRAVLEGLSLSTQVSDLEKDYRIQTDKYDLIICFNYLQRSLIHDIKAGLKNGGMVVYETFTLDQARFGRPCNPDFLLGYNELLEMFRDFRCLHYREGIFEHQAIASLIAKKIVPIS